MAGVPEFSQFEKDKAILQSAADDSGVRLYTDEQIDGYTDDQRTVAVQAEKKRLLVAAFTKDNETRPREEPDGEGGFTTLEKLTETEIEEGVDELLANEAEAEPPAVSEEAAGEPVPPDENFPIPAPVFETPPAPSIQEILAEDVKKQLEKPTIPPLVPVGSLTELDLFIEPITRLMFVLLVAKPTGFFYTAINVPCAYPLIIPPFYPVTMVGKVPAGVIALAFMDPTLPVCTNSKPADLDILSNDLKITIPLEPDPDIKPCDPQLSFPELAACIKALNKQMKDRLGPIELTPQLKALLDLIAERSKVEPPQVTPPERSTQEETEILVEDGIDGLFEGVNIIE